MTKGAGLLVGLCYPVIVTLAVLLLASVQLRSSGGAAFDTWRLNYNANRFLAPSLAMDYEKIRKDSVENLDSLTFAELCLKLYDTNGILKSGIDQDLLDEAKRARNAGEEDDAYEGELHCLIRGFIRLSYDKQFYEQKKESFAKDLANVQRSIDANNDQYAELIKGHQEFLAFREMERNGAWYSKLIVVTPYDLMVLLLVMLMGALGGMVRLLRDYGDSNRLNPPSHDYFFIPLIGLVVAIGGYIFAKTGLLLLSSTREETSLSPFMIGLVGIVSGLLAKDVIDAIARAGIKMVNNEQVARTAQAGTSGTGGAGGEAIRPVDQ